MIHATRKERLSPEEALRLLAGHAPLFAPLITHSRPLEKIAEAFHIAEHYADGVGKMVVA